MKIALLAKSDSGGQPYKVEFLADGPSLRVYCHCLAGVKQWICKHKMELIKGDVKRLFDPKQVELLSIIQSWPQFNDLKKRTEEFENNLHDNWKARMNISSEFGELLEARDNNSTESIKNSVFVGYVISRDDPDYQKTSEAYAESRRQEKVLKEEFMLGLTFGFHRDVKRN